MSTIACGRKLQRVDLSRIVSSLVALCVNRKKITACWQKRSTGDALIVGIWSKKRQDAIVLFVAVETISVGVAKQPIWENTESTTLVHVLTERAARTIGMRIVHTREIPYEVMIWLFAKREGRIFQ